MKRCLLLFAAFALFAGIGRLSAAEPQLAHMVFFTLAEDNQANRETLVAACQKYLSDHNGTVHFSAGSIADDLDREVNDREFDVALHLVFANKAAHDTYQTHPQHLEFIEKNKQLWSTVRVFDSYLPATGYDALPTAARGFSGTLQGKVVAKTDGGIIVAVQKITKVLQQSKAGEAKALVGKNVLVTARDGEGRAARFIAAVKVGIPVRLDVGGRFILGLAEDQQEQVKE